jgi:lipid-A-disaccharide synthase
VKTVLAGAPVRLRKAPPRSPAILFSAGEASGDLHGSVLCKALGQLAPGHRLYGMGGRRMAAAGVDVIADVTGDAVIGGSEALGGLPAFYRAFRRLTAELRAEPRPGALVLIDFPEFNLRLARAARRADVPVVYFVPPQVWAWRPWRARAIVRDSARILAAFPFEVDVYRAAGGAVEFVGHPLVDGLAAAPTREIARRRLGVASADPVLGLLPGSRRHEVDRLLPAMAEAAAHVVAMFPGARVVLGRAPTIDREDVVRGVDGIVDVVEGATHDVIAASDLLLAASGTVTLEAALLGTPMVVCYRASMTTELMARLLVQIPWISLANISLGRTVVPELLQRDATGPLIGREAVRLLGDPAALSAQREAFKTLAGRFGEPGVGARAARAVLAAMAEHSR